MDLFHLNFWSYVWRERQRRNNNELKTRSVYFKLWSSFPTFLLLYAFQSPQTASPCTLSWIYSCINWETGWSVLTPSYLELKQGHCYVWFFFLRFYLFIWERMRDREHEREEGQREKQTPRWAGSLMWDSIPGLRNHDLSRGQLLNQLSHPGAQRRYL